MLLATNTIHTIHRYLPSVIFKVSISTRTYRYQDVLVIQFSEQLNSFIIRLVSRQVELHTFTDSDLCKVSQKRGNLGVNNHNYLHTTYVGYVGLLCTYLTTSYILRCSLKRALILCIRLFFFFFFFFSRPTRRTTKCARWINRILQPLTYARRSTINETRKKE